MTVVQEATRLAALFVALAVAACWTSGSPGGAGSDGGAADGDTDTDVDSDADTDSDSDSDGDTDTSSPVNEQGPVTIIVTNISEQPVYLNGQHSFYAEPQYLTCYHEFPAEDCLLVVPDCAYACEEVDEGEGCCVDCGYWPIMLELEPEEGTLFEWDGWLRQANWDHCDDGCECFDKQSISTAGSHYEFGVQYWLDIECPTEDGICPDPDSFGYIDPAEPVGTVGKVSTTIPLLVASGTATEARSVALSNTPSAL